MGSPLAHAAFLMARKDRDFLDKKTQREFPTCPPELETIGAKRQFSYTDPASGVRVPHHAAVFAPTRWTNLYFPCRATLWGDIIGGAAAPAFGPGIRDLAVETRLNDGIFTHTKYWDLPRAFAGKDTPEKIESLRRDTPANIVSLRRALNVSGLGAPTDEEPQ